MTWQKCFKGVSSVRERERERQKDRELSALNLLILENNLKHN